MENNFRKRNLIVKKYFLFVIFSCFSFFINAEQMKETFWGIPFGSDFSIVNDKIISKGFYLDKKVEISSDISQGVYKNRNGVNGGKFAETKPQSILIEFSESKGMTAATIYWDVVELYKENEIIRDAFNNNDSEKAFNLMGIYSKRYFSTLVNSLNKKYGTNIDLPNTFQSFGYEILNSKNLRIIFGVDLTDLMTGEPSAYILHYESSLYEEVVNDDV